jgi:hypothetical protein
LSKEPCWEPKENPNEGRSFGKQAIYTRALKNSLYFGFYNFQKFFKKGEAKLIANYRRNPLKSL